jgi:hypothetical protein
VGVVCAACVVWRLLAIEVVNLSPVSLCSECLPLELPFLGLPFHKFPTSLLDILGRQCSLCRTREPDCSISYKHMANNF